MSDAIDVSPEALHEHATAVRNLMSEITAATANAGDTLDLQTYGIACTAPAQILQVWIQSADSFIRQATNAGNSVGQAVTGMAYAYELNEQEHQAAFRSIHGGLDGGN